MRSKEVLGKTPFYFALFLSFLPTYSYGFQSPSYTTICKYRSNLSIISPSSQLFSSPVEDDDKSVSTPKLTKQEEILQNALNIQPESIEEKSQRLAQAQQIEEEQTKKKSSNILIALLSFSAAILNYLYQYTHPVTDVQLLFAMSQSSAPLTEIGTNGKPTVVDFWAPWCENCKRSASTLAAIEKEYGDSVNFVMVNGDEAKKLGIDRTISC